MNQETAPTEECFDNIVSLLKGTTASTPIVDVTGPEPVITRGRVPARSVVIPGSTPKEFPGGTFHTPCALIIGQRKASTDRKTSLNEVLRTFEVPV